jgi:hypothetical protein
MLSSAGQKPLDVDLHALGHEAEETSSHVGMGVAFLSSHWEVRLRRLLQSLGHRLREIVNRQSAGLKLSWRTIWMSA